MNETRGIAGIGWEDAVVARVDRVRVGDTWRNWLEMAKDLLLADPNSDRMSPLQREGINKKIASFFDYEVEGRLIRVTAKRELPYDVMVGVLNKTRQREVELDKVLANALLTAAEDTSKFSKRLSNDSPKLSQPVKDYVESLKGTEREIVTLQLTTMQILEILGVACYPDELEIELQKQFDSNEIQSEAEKRFLSSYVRTKVWNKSKLVVESFLERMAKRYYIVYHRGFLFEYSGKIGSKWGVPSIEETVLLAEAKRKICTQVGCRDESEIRSKISFRDYKKLVIQELAPLGVSNYCNIYQVAFQKGTLALFMGKKTSELPEDKSKLLQEFMISFYKSDKKYMEKQEKLWGLITEEDYSQALLAVEYAEIVEDGVDPNKLEIPDNFSCSLVRKDFAEKNKPLYKGYLK